ncbi:MAG TPA: hypothetical protein VGH54_05580 [Mycobacterium sp.]|jgi:hypothetical protein|uniref:hypothetical protein n=1 Tax=Mycobacterium sp. TaxID=1785 RepID=UPI002F405661
MGGDTGDKPDDLAKVERLAREVVLRKGDWTISPDELGELLAEYDRLQAVERAAAEFLDQYEDDGGDYEDERAAADRLRALLTAAGPHQTGPENEETL